VSNSLNISMNPELDEIMGAGFVSGTDSLKILSDRADTIVIAVAGVLPNTQNLINGQTNINTFHNALLVGVNAEVDNALNTAIPGSPTAESINDRILKLDGLASLHTMTYAVSDTLIHANDTEAMDNIDVYEKVKEILCPITGTIRLKFDIRCDAGASSARGKIYKNRIAHGAEQTNATTGYITYSEDLAFVQGDTIELWVVEPIGTHDIWYRNLRVCGNLQRYFENTME